jgi:F-type H+-transporting ATPase subunit a
MFSPLEQFDIIGLLNLQMVLFFPSILIPFIIVLIGLYFILYFFIDNLKLIPSCFQRIFEIFFLFIFNLIKQQIGKEGYIYFPLIFSLFTFILFLNLLSLFPFGMALTSHLIMII